jgi:hypothetical protein
LRHVARNISSIFTHGKVEDEHGLVYSAAEVQAKPVLIKTLDKLEKLADMLMESDVVAFDSELTSLNRVANTLLTLQFSVDSRRGFIVPYDHRESPFKNKLGEVKELLRPFFYNPDVDPFDTSRYLVGLNVQFDLTVVKQAFGIPFLPWPVWDRLDQSGHFCIYQGLRVSTKNAPKHVISLNIEQIKREQKLSILTLICNLNCPIRQSFINSMVNFIFPLFS